MIRVRFAPSPTGDIHIGNIRTAIFNWLFARNSGGKFLLRIEDTDRSRSTEEAIRKIFEALEWLGIDYDEKPLFQSMRYDIYKNIAEELVKRGFARYDDMGKQQLGKCIVFKSFAEDIEFHDIVKGRICKKGTDIPDFVIVRSDGTPVFHLANVVDDIEMEITHVIRGDDHVDNTFKHIMLYRAIGAPIPYFAHLPMIVNEKGKPYSKRDGAVFIGQFREAGFLSEAMFNFLVLLGWSPGDNREKLSREELIKIFDLKRVRSSPSKFDFKKLLHLNAQYIAEMPTETFIEYAKSFLKNTDWYTDVSEEKIKRVAELMQIRTHTFADCYGWKYFFNDNFDYDEINFKKISQNKKYIDALKKLTDIIQSINFVEEEIEKSIREVENEYNIKKGELNQVIRIVITGVTKGAGIYETMVVIGRDKCIRRLTLFCQQNERKCYRN